MLGVVVNGRLLLELLEHAYERRENWIITVAHQVWESAPEVRRRLLEMVVRYAGEHVVHLVRPDGVDDVVNDAIVAVDGGQLASHEVPLFVGVPRYVDLAVVQERHHDDEGAEH